MNFEPSFLNSIQFNDKNGSITGGYVYPKPKPKPQNMYNQNYFEKDYIEGGSKSFMQVPVGLVVNKYDDNMSINKGQYKGVIDINRINEFLDLNYKPLKQITKKNQQKHNTSVKKK